MKKQTTKLCAKILLVSTLTLPTMVYASGTPGAAQPVTDQPAEQSLSDIHNLLSSDITRARLGDNIVNALINYEAAARLNEYQRNMQLLFMMAPGSQFALVAGTVASNSTYPANGVSPLYTSALNLSNAGLASTLSQLTSKDDYTLNNQTYSRNSDYNKDQVGYLYSLLSDFYTKGDASKIAPFLPAQFMLTDNLATKGLNGTPAQDFISIMTNPIEAMPAAMTNLSGGIDNLTDPSLKGKAQEAMVDEMVKTALIGVSTSAWADIVARRTPQNGQTKSVMEIMDQHSQDRFSRPEWFAQVSTASDTALLRELVQIAAYNQWAQFQQFRVQEQQMALLASMNTVMAQINAALIGVQAQIKDAEAQAKAQGDALQQQLQNSNTNSSGSSGSSGGT